MKTTALTDPTRESEIIKKPQAGSRENVRTKSIAVEKGKKTVLPYSF